jgi:hypothetical protein
MLQPAVQEVALKEPFSGNLGGRQSLIADETIYFFLINSKILSSIFGVHQ